MAFAATASKRGAHADMDKPAIDVAKELARLSALTIFELRGEWRRRHAELSRLFAGSSAGLVYVTAFPNRAIMGRIPSARSSNGGTRAPSDEGPRQCPRRVQRSRGRILRSLFIRARGSAQTENGYGSPTR
jgi:hypothetical protein